MITLQCIRCHRLFDGRPGASCPFCPAETDWSSIIGWVIGLVFVAVIYLVIHIAIYHGCVLPVGVFEWPTLVSRGCTESVL